MENVTGILSIANGTVVNIIKTEFERLGYRIAYAILKAEEYGVPQERRRIFFIGTNTNNPILFPEKTHGAGLQPFTTIWDAISDLPKIDNGEDPGIVDYANHANGWFQQSVRGNSVKVHNHAAPKLGRINLKRMQYIHQGGSWRDIPFDLLPAGMKRAKRSDHTKRYGRMNRWPLLYYSHQMRHSLGRLHSPNSELLYYCQRSGSYTELP